MYVYIYIFFFLVCVFMSVLAAATSLLCCSMFAFHQVLSLSGVDGL